MSLKSIIFVVFVLSISGYAHADKHFPILRDSKEQIEFGRILFNKQCARCHGKKLEGVKYCSHLMKTGIAKHHH